MQDPEATQLLHPTTLLFELGSTIRRQLIPAIVALWGASSGSVLGGSIAIAFFVLSTGFVLFRYFGVRYGITEKALHVSTGIWFRTHKTVPWERIHNMDVVQNVFHRMLRVVEVRVETASGVEPEAILKVISLVQYQSLLASVEAARSVQVASPLPPSSTSASIPQNTNPAVGTSPPTSAPRRTELLRIPLRSLVLAGLTTDRGLALLLVPIGLLWESRVISGRTIRARSQDVEQLFPLFAQSMAWWILTFLALGVLAIVVVKILSVVWYLSRFYGYTLCSLGDELRIECGLLTRVSSNVRRDQIQLICIHRTWLGRWLGIASIRIETAGGGKEEEDAASTMARRWFVPVIEEKDLESVLVQLRPRACLRETTLDWKPFSRRASARVLRKWIVLALLIAVVMGFFQVWLGLVSAILVAALGWLVARRVANSFKYARTRDGLVFRSGIFTRKCSFTFFDKIQSIKLEHSPFDRKWNMATLSVDTIAAGPADHTIRIPMLDFEFANSERRAISQILSSEEAQAA